MSLSINNEKRRAHISQEFANKNVDFEFFDAVTPQDNSFLLSKYRLNHIPTELSPVEISCFLSHYKIWQKMINEDLPFVTVFEDDIYLGEDADLFLNNTEWLDPAIHILKLEKGIQKSIKLSFLAKKKLYNRSIFKLKSAHFGTAGYIISNMGARFLTLQYERAKELRPIDVFMFRVLLADSDYRVMQLSPALCIQDFLVNKSHKNFESAIELARVKKIYNRDRQKINAITKIRREVQRPFFQIGKALLERRVKFR